MTMFRKKNDFTEMWSFVTNKENNQFRQLYLRHMDFFEWFVDYFIQNGSELLDCSNRDKLAILDTDQLIYSESTEQEFEVISSLLNDIKGKYEKLLKVPSYKSLLMTIKDRQVSITKRELDCLKLIARGMTMKETATMLQITPRTVEEHTRKIRVKARLNSTSQIIQEILNNKHLRGFVFND